MWGDRCDVMDIHLHQVLRRLFARQGGLGITATQDSNVCFSVDHWVEVKRWLRLSWRKSRAGSRGVAGSTWKGWEREKTIKEERFKENVRLKEGNMREGERERLDERVLSSSSSNIHLWSFNRIQQTELQSLSSQGMVSTAGCPF